MISLHPQDFTCYTLLYGKELTKAMIGNRLLKGERMLKGVRLVDDYEFPLRVDDSGIDHEG